MYNKYMIILVGPSASGKTEVAKKLVESFGFSKVVTYTSRPKRKGEKSGVDYHFITEESFLRKKDKDFFLETTKYNGNYYGTSYNEIDINKVLIVDPNGLKAYRELHDNTIISFYLLASEQKRIDRMITRGDLKEDIVKRLESDKVNFSYNKIGNIDFVIDTENSSVRDIAQNIYEKYAKKLSEVGKL